MNKQLQNKIKTYSALAATAALASSQANAQMVSRTINHTNDNYDAYDIDIDGDGVIDFMYSGNAFGTYGINLDGGYGAIYGAYNSYLSSGSYNYNSWLWNNEMKGYGALSYMGKGEKVGRGYSFDSYQFFGGGYTFASSSGSTGAGTFGALTDTKKSFVGVYFVKMDADGLKNLHYGWMKFTDIDNKARKWTLAEVGYDAQPRITAFTDTDYSKDYFVANPEIKGNLGNLTKGVEVQPITEHKYFNEVNYYRVKVVRASNTADHVNYENQITAGNDYYVDETGSGTNKQVNGGSNVLDMDFNDLIPGETYNVYTVAFGYNNDPLRLTSSSTIMRQPLSVDDLFASVLDVYAADKTITINAGNEHMNSTVKIFDVTGREVYTGTVDSNKKSISLNDAAGIYIVNIDGANGKTSKKVVLR